MDRDRVRSWHALAETLARRMTGPRFPYTLRLMPWTKLCDLADLKETEGKYVQVKDRELAVFLHNGKPNVLDNYCPHAGGNLAGGWVDTIGETPCAVCPWHAWPFRLDNGQLRDTPSVSVTTYPTRIVDGAVEADL